MIGLVVKSIPEAIAFYKLLGVEVGEPDGGPYHEAKLPSGIRLSWNTVELAREIDGHWDEPVGHRSGLAFLCDSPAEVDAVFKEVTGAGYEGKRAPWNAFWGQRYAQVVDPDGNVVDLFAPL